MDSLPTPGRRQDGLFPCIVTVGVLRRKVQECPIIALFFRPAGLETLSWSDKMALPRSPTEADMRTLVSHPASQLVSVLLGGILISAMSGCGNSTAEVEKARQSEAEMAKRLQECEAQLAEARKALEAARRGSSKAGADTAEGIADAQWQAARLVADVFLDAVNSRDAEAADAAGTKGFQVKNGGQ